MQTLVRLTLRAVDLPNIAGVFNVSDPYASVSLKVDGEDEVLDLGRTEVLRNTLSPDWTSTFTFSFKLGKPASIMVKVFDKDTKGDEDKYICGTMFSVSSVLAKCGNTLGKKMKGGGTLIATIEKEDSEAFLIFQLRGSDLKNVENTMFSKSDPFFEVSKRIAGSDEWLTVFRSEYVKKDLNPLWNAGKVDLDHLCSNDFNASLRITVLDHESNADHIEIGELETSVNELLVAKKFGGGGDNDSGQSQLNLFDSKKNVSGVINVIEARVCGKEVQSIIASEGGEEKGCIGGEDDSTLKKPGFIDFVSGGCELSLCIAIDYTGSNGDPRVPGTLHYINPDGSLNDYERAIVEIGSILADFDTDQHFPVWGFGAKINDEVRHAFALMRGEVGGIKGVLESYRSSFSTGLIMSRPTDITQILQVAAVRARKLQESSSGGLCYSVCLILTDGAVYNVDETIETLNEIKDAPLSIIIVGIGDEDFTDMQFLEDNGKATFVPFKGHESTLKEETLEKLPSQMVEYFISKDIYPSVLSVSPENICIE